MKNPLPRLIFTAFACLIFLGTITDEVLGQENCAVSKYHGQGYTTSIASITDNDNESYTIVLLVEHNGCPGPECKKLNQYSVEADSGTYSDISIEVISGNFTFANINYGPDLGGDPFDGFRISNTNGMGNGEQAAFTITYTLTGGFQDQQTLAKASSDNLIVSFTVAEFESVLECQNTMNIYPYYKPPENGKLDSTLIGAELTSLYEVYIDSGTYSSDDIFQIVDTMVLIDIYSKPGQFNDLLALLQTSAYGLIPETQHPTQQEITGLYPIVNLLLLNDLPDLINYARPVYPAVVNSGIVTSQGDTSMRSYVARNAFNLQGNGVKIGVISDSYNTQMGNPAADDVLRGDLPGVTNPDNPLPVDVLEDYPYGTRSDEGRAMLQIIHDIAPKAELAFRTGFKSAADFAQGIRDLQLAGCDLIVDDITYMAEPFLRDGVVAQAVEEVVSLGTAYFSAAGNFGSKSYQSTFHPSPAPSGMTGTAHDFSGGANDIYQSISLTEGNYTIVLQWDDGTGSALTSVDLDIYLARESGSFLFGFNRVNTGTEAIEVLPFTVSGGSAETNLLIVKASGTDDVFLKYVIFRGNVTVNEYFSASSTIVGQANAQSAIAVGAVLYSNTPEYGVNPPTIASFSSRGGTPVNGVLRIKPDITAPNGVNTTVDLGGVNIDGDLFPNFFGTSAAAPHAAGVAALIMEAKSKYYDTMLSPVELRGILQSTATDMDAAGFDFSSGYGFILADEALSTLASPSPVITGLFYDTTLVPGVDPILISVTGNYLTSQSVIYFNGAPLDSGSVLVNDTLITGLIPAFTDRYPEIQVYNPPLPQTNGTDGGLSNPLYFTTKKTVVINIHNEVKKYGEDLPEFSADYSVEGIDGIFSLEEEGLSPEQITRIMSIPFETVATPLSNVGLWEIEAALGDPLNPLSSVSPADSIDITLLDNYNFDFDNGLLSIEKLDVLIVPRDTVFTYGDSIGGFQFDYIYNNDTINPGNNVVISPATDDSLQALLQETHASALVNAVARVPATALVNEWGEPLLDSANLVNTSLIISEATALLNATALANGTLIDPEALYNAIALVNTITKSGSTALVPATALVNGTALVNTYDSDGNLVSATPLVNSTALVNAIALVNTSTINANSNSDAIVILGDGDIRILSGDSTGAVTLRSINMITGNSVGEHLIIPGSYLSNNLNLSYGLGKMTIIPAIATVTADTKVIFAGDTLPVFTASFDGFVNGETDTVVNSLTFTLSPEYTGSAGTYQIIPSATADNYIFTPVNGNLYVNPFGAGTKNVKTVLDCVEVLNPPDSNGFTHLAHFRYTNDNATDVFIFYGPDNNISGTGSFNAVQQPELFVAGGGTFEVPFDGIKMTWTVKTFNGNGHKTSSASSASSKSSKCAKSTPAEAISPDDEAELSGMVAYPNPVREKLTIDLDGESASTDQVSVFDIYGKQSLAPVTRTSSSVIEIGMAGLPAGLYFVRITHGETIETIRVIKL